MNISAKKVKGQNESNGKTLPTHWHSESPSFGHGLQSQGEHPPDIAISNSNNGFFSSKRDETEKRENVRKKDETKQL